MKNWISLFVIAWRLFVAAWRESVRQRGRVCPVSMRNVYEHSLRNTKDLAVSDHDAGCLVRTGLPCVGTVNHGDKWMSHWRCFDPVARAEFNRRMGHYENGPQVQGEAAIHHKGGWTALAFWDRSVDHRGGCNSVFFAEGTYGPEPMLAIAAACVAVAAK